jgi:hypothetical protein
MLLQLFYNDVRHSLKHNSIWEDQQFCIRWKHRKTNITPPFLLKLSENLSAITELVILLSHDDSHIIQQISFDQSTQRLNVCWAKPKRRSIFFALFKVPHNHTPLSAFLTRGGCCCWRSALCLSRERKRKKERSAQKKRASAQTHGTKII